MKRLLLILTLLNSVCVFAQQFTPVQWKVVCSERITGVYELRVEGIIEDGWHVYADDDNVSGLEAVKTSINNKQIGTGKLVPIVSSMPVFDPVFSKNQRVYKGVISFKQEVRVDKPLSLVEVQVLAYASNGSAFLPIDTTIEVVLDDKAAAGNVPPKLKDVDLNNPLSACGAAEDQDKSLFWIFLLGAAGGLIALLTPCVFPMIPVTVSFFTNKSKTRSMSYRNGMLYGGFILLIYLAASVPFHLAGNISPEIFNVVATNAWVNIFFFVVFILFALSFFGVFELRLPAGVANAAGSKGGIFFMALTLAIVSFSCTGPILGTLLVGSLSASGNAWQLTAGMAGFGLALGLPFALFAFFPSWLKALPKSGGWMDVVKKSLAFVELALAIKFLSNADLVEHWGILKREVFIGLWLVIAVLLAMYLFGVFDKKKVGMYNADKLVRVSIPVGRKIIGFAVAVFGLYLVPGLTSTAYANLTLLSGFPPPLSYSIYKENGKNTVALEPDVVNDYKAAVELSRKVKKPLLIDFTGWACVNCRKMEEQVWTKPEIRKLIEENFVLVSLYVDDRKKRDDGSTIGKWNANFQAKNFGQVTQPLYVILSSDEKLVNHPVGFTPDEDEYSQWLACGLETINKTMQ